MVVEDKDKDGSFSWMAWGSEIAKTGSSDRVGVAILGEETAIGKIKGQIKWEDREEGTRRGKVRIQSLTSEDLWVAVKTDSQGVYEAEVPSGTYQVEAGYGRSRERVDVVEVQAGHTVRTEAHFFPRPQLGTGVKAGVGRVVVAGAGRVVVAGAGKERVAGAGLRQALWQNLEAVDGLEGNGVPSMLEDRSGQLWFGTYGGVSRYDGQTFTTFTTDDGLAHN